MARDPHQLPHVVSQAGEVGLHAQVLQAHVGQDVAVLSLRADQELGGELPQVPPPLSVWSEKEINVWVVLR